MNCWERICLPLALLTVASSNFFTVVHSCPPPGTTLMFSGSWVVQPIVTLWADFFDCPGVSISIKRGSNEEGIGRVCGAIADPTDMGGTTRVVRSTEATPVSSVDSTFQCVGSERQIVAVDIALDGLVILSVIGGTASRCLQSLGTISISQMRWMFSNWTETELSQTGTWDPETTIPNSDSNPNTKLWCELSSSCPCVPILTAGSAPDTRPHQYMAQTTGFTESETFSDTYMQFTERSDLLRYMDRNRASVGYMRFAEFSRANLLLDAMPVVDPRTNVAVPPTSATLVSGKYTPYSRRAYLYVWTEAIDHVLPFLEFGFSELGTSLVDQVNLVPLPAEERRAILTRLNLDGGTVAPRSSPIAQNSTSRTADKDPPASSAPRTMPIRWVLLIGTIMFGLFSRS